MTTLVGQQIGHIRVVDVIGKGGMGEVYVGYDERLERKVALKSIRAEGKLDDGAKARFLREARVLSHMAHPNICQIYDYIDGQDADLLVLELIRGKTLARAIKERLDHRQKLRIAQQIARVLVAAHERNVVHRDLKPDNVMLTDEGDVKVLDFGLARSTVEETMAVNPAGIVDTMSLPAQPGSGDSGPARVDHRASSGVTIQGAIMGSPGYMSPEQAAGEVVTPASDLYSFGLLLQELFMEKRPFERSNSIHAMVRMSYEGISLPVEGLDPDLTALINRLKSKAPAARPSAVDALERIQWIIDKPSRRRKRALLVASMVVLALFGVVMTIQTIRATRAERAAKREADVARSVTNFLIELFDVSDPFEQKSGETITAREILDKGARKIAEELKGQPEVQSRVMATIGTVYRKLGLFAEAKPQLERARKLLETSYDPNDREVAEVLFALASLYSDEGNYAGAEPLFQRSLAIHEKISGPDDAHVADVLNNLATLHARRGKFEEARPLLERSLTIRETAFGRDSPVVADSLNNLALLHSIQGRQAESEALYRRSLTIREKVFGREHPRVGDSLNNLAVEFLENERVSDAEPLAARAVAIFETTLGPEHPHYAHAVMNLAEIRHLRGKRSEAETLYKRGLGVYRKISGPNHPDVGYALSHLGKLYVDERRLKEAEPLLTLALSIYEKSVGPEHPDTAQTLFNLAALEARKENESAALDYLKRAFPAGSGTRWARSIDTEEAFARLRANPAFTQIAQQAKSES